MAKNEAIGAVTRGTDKLGRREKYRQGRPASGGMVVLRFPAGPQKGGKPAASCLLCVRILQLADWLAEGAVQCEPVSGYDSLISGKFAVSPAGRTLHQVENRAVSRAVTSIP